MSCGGIAEARVWMFSYISAGLWSSSHTGKKKHDTSGGEAQVIVTRGWDRWVRDLVESKWQGPWLSQFGRPSLSEFGASAPSSPQFSWCGKTVRSWEMRSVDRSRIRSTTGNNSATYRVICNLATGPSHGSCGQSFPVRSLNAASEAQRKRRDAGWHTTILVLVSFGLTM